MKENHLYVYIPRPNTVQRHGVYAPSNAPFEKVQHYVKRTAEYYNIDELDVDHKKIMQYLETWFRGRSRAISVLTEPIPDTASERILEFRNMSDCITLPSFEELKKYNIAEACYLSVDGGKDKKVDGPDYSPVNWKQDKTPQFRFKGIRHYFIVLKSGVVPAKYCTIGNDFAEESVSDNPVVMKEAGSNIDTNTKDPNYKFEFYIRDEKIGYGYYRDETGYKSYKAYYINDIFIYPKHRGKGFGTKCFHLLLEKVKSVAHGISIYLEVEKDNVPAVKIYERAGFKTFKEFKDSDKIICRMFLGKPIDFESLSEESYSEIVTESLNKCSNWIKSINDIKEFYRNCLYGMIDYRKNPPVCIPAEKTSNFDWIFGYKFSSVEDTVKYNCGTCLNAAYVADKFLSDWKIEHESIFIHPMSKWDLRPQTHCCVLYKQDGKWRLLDSIPEMIDNDLVGTTYKDLAKQVVSMHCKAYDKEMTYSLITRYPEVGDGIFKVLNCTDDWVNGKLVKTFGSDLKYAVTVFKNAIYSIGSFSQESLSDKVASNIENNKVYHASPLKLDVLKGKASKTKDAESSVFVSPFKHFASMFILDFQGIVDTIEEQIGKKHIKIDNFGFMEWNETPRSTTSIPSKVHVCVRTQESFKPFKGKATGYLYTIDFSKYKDKAGMWSHAQGSDVELIIHGDVHYEKCEQITLEYEVMKDTFKNYHAEESMSNTAQENFGFEDDSFVDNVIKPKIRDNTLYHGSRDKFSVIKAQQISELKDKGVKSISLTPYKRLASLFCIPLRSLGADKNGKSLYKHRRIRLDEWFDDVSEDDKYKAVKTVHVSHNIPDIDPIDEYYTGYLYYVDADQSLRNAGKNPINGKGPNEVLCFDKELKPYKIEQIRVRWIARYSKSFSREEGGDVIPTDPFDPSLEDFNGEYMENFAQESEFVGLDIGIQMLSESNAGIEEFNRWVRDLDLYSIKKDLNDPQVDMVFSQIAQENILVDTVKSIFRKIGEFIAWFFRKLKELWNYFFGKTQRAMRALKAANERITRHKNSNGFFNDGAFEACKAPEGLVTAIGLNTFIITGFSPDVFNNIFKEILDLWVSNPQELYDEIFVKMPQLTSSHKWKMLYVLLPLKRGSGMMEPTQFIKEKYPARGSMHDSAYDRDSVFILLKGAMDMLSAYEVNSKLISSKGNITVDAANRILQYQDRTDVSEHEAIKLAKDIQELANWLQVMFKGYEKSFEFVLYQMGMVTNIYGQFMK